MARPTLLLALCAVTMIATIQGEFAGETPEPQRRASVR
jgi:hypothetical protein